MTSLQKMIHIEAVVADDLLVDWLSFRINNCLTGRLGLLSMEKGHVSPCPKNDARFRG